ncbi:2-succinyl-6-hydroxy-2,4-cyclohexadiene-1-carboxylate synthase [Salinicoccus roseus]|uniref:Putative 2-succinyl-6-hydroxy-2,4-cyclohexadiene-1-carboxylate synthase n=1 Tax=Salinicoccus roseus TaxID=45670 RepID=A0A265E8F7_9STAP|nr:2-succinyl-6-hydroxy-2,4-cyclohexadiene-1-carboxylate synthase [Salinicoccus roseus]OZT77800.1 2-succinyl-6-hydroxy-2,4-cyclohexadiene-1-carboxylate synthase [Salinicoccus roseus]
MKFNHRFADDGKSRTLLLLHGFLSDMTSMDGVAGELSSHYNILAVDLPGFGGTPSAGIDYGMEDIAEGLRELLASLDLDQVDVLGYSMGGRAALSFIANHPECVGRAVLESTSPGIASENEREKRRSVDAARAAHINEDFKGFIAGWEDMGLFSSQQALSEKVREQQRLNRLSQEPEEAADSLVKYGTGVQPSYWEALRRIDCPVLLLAGKRDEKFVGINSRMSELLPDARLEIIDGAGHNIHMEAPQKFVTIVLDFLLGG